MSAVAVATGEKVTVSASVSGSGSARSSHKLRALRHLASEFGVGPISVTAWHPRLQVVNLTCENLSMSGLCLRLLGGAGAGQRAEVSADDWVLGVHASLQSGEVVCHSDAIVRHCRVDGDDLLIGVQLVKGVVDLPLLFERQTRCGFAARLDELERSTDTRRILPEFKEWVSDLRNYLERMRVFLDREEAALESEDLYTHGQICAQYLAEVGPRIVQRVHQASHGMGPLLSALGEDEHAAHRAYARRQLHPLVLCSPFVYRTFHKPLGYAGDYEMVNMILRDAHEGATMFAKIVNVCFLQNPPAQAHRNRIVHLKKRLAEEKLDAFAIEGGWPLFGAPQPYRDLFKPLADRIASGDFVISAADTIGDEVAIAKEGLVTALVGQRPFEMGYKAPSVMIDLIEGKKVDDPVFTGLDECTKDTVDTCIQK